MRMHKSHKWIAALVAFAAAFAVGAAEMITAREAEHIAAEYDRTNIASRIDGKQPLLVSGTNIKTVNGSSLLGSGNLQIDTGSDVVRSNAVGNALVKGLRFDAEGGMSATWGDSDDVNVGVFGLTVSGGQAWSAFGAELGYTGLWSLALGPLAHAYSDESVAIGYYANDGVWENGQSVAVGAWTLAGEGGTAVGWGTFAGDGSIAIGAGAVADNFDAAVFGRKSENPESGSHGTNTINFWQTDDPKRIYFRDKTLDGIVAETLRPATNALGSAKADKVSGATSGNFAALDENGNLEDSGWNYTLFAASYNGDPAVAVSAHSAETATTAAKLSDPNTSAPEVVNNGERWGTTYGLYAYLSELPVISPTDPTFTNAVLAVGGEAWTNNLTDTESPNYAVFSNAVLSVGIDTNVLAAVAASTNAVAQVGKFYAAFADIGITPTQGGMTLAGLLATLVAAVTWLKRKALTNGKRTDGSPDDEKLRDFFAESNTLLKNTIAEETADKRDKTDLEVYEEDPETGEPTPTGETLATSADLGGKQDALSVQQLANIADVQNKVAKETGKGLSTNDYTTADKQLVAGAFQKSNIAVPSSESLTDDQVLGAASAKDFINSSVQTATANFRGNFADWTAVPTDTSQYEQDAGGSRTPTTNDYMVVINAEGFGNYTANVSTGIVGRTLAVAVAGFAVGHVFVVADIATLTAAGVAQVTLKRDSTWRFKYTGLWSADGKAGWSPEYRVNEAPLTAAQLAALNSGVTSDAVQKADGALRFDAAQTLTDGQKAQLWANLGLDDFNGEEF